MLLLCKKCNIILYTIENDMYTIKNIIITNHNIHMFNINCKFCFNNIGLYIFGICKKCLFKKNIIDEKNFIYYYEYYVNSSFNTCYYCKKKFYTINFLNKNNYILKFK